MTGVGLLYIDLCHSLLYHTLVYPLYVPAYDEAVLIKLSLSHQSLCYTASQYSDECKVGLEHTASDKPNQWLNVCHREVLINTIDLGVTDELTMQTAMNKV